MKNTEMQFVYGSVWFDYIFSFLCVCVCAQFSDCHSVSTLAKESLRLFLCNSREKKQQQQPIVNLHRDEARISMELCGKSIKQIKQSKNEKNKQQRTGIRYNSGECAHVNCIRQFPIKKEVIQENDMQNNLCVSVCFAPSLPLALSFLPFGCIVVHLKNIWTDAAEVYLVAYLLFHIWMYRRLFSQCLFGVCLCVCQCIDRISWSFFVLFLKRTCCVFRFIPMINAIWTESNATESRWLWAHWISIYPKTEREEQESN